LYIVTIIYIVSNDLSGNTKKEMMEEWVKRFIRIFMNWQCYPCFLPLQ